MIQFISNPRPQKFSKKDWELYDLVVEKVKEAQSKPLPASGFRPQIKFKYQVDYDLMIKRLKGLAEKRIKDLRKAIKRISNEKDYQQSPLKKEKVKMIVRQIMRVEEGLKEEDGNIAFKKWLQPINIIVKFKDEEAGSGHSVFNEEIELVVNRDFLNENKLKTLIKHELTHQKDPFLIKDKFDVKDTVSLILNNIYGKFYHSITDKRKKSEAWASHEYELTARLAEWELGVSSDPQYAQFIVDEAIEREKGKAGGLKSSGGLGVLESAAKELSKHYGISNFIPTKTAKEIKTDIDKGISYLEKQREFRKKAIQEEFEIASLGKKSRENALLIKDLKKIRKDLKIGTKGKAKKLFKETGLKSFKKVEDYLYDSLDTYKLMGFRSGNYSLNAKIIKLFARSILHRIKEAMNRELFKELTQTSDILKITSDSRLDPLVTGRDEFTQITIDDLKKAKQGFKNQFNRYLRLIHSILVSNGIKFNLRSDSDNKKVFIPVKKVETLKNILEKSFKEFNESKENNGVSFVQIKDVSENFKVPNTLKVDVDIYNQSSAENLDKIKRLNNKIVSIFERAVEESKAPVTVRFLPNQYFSDLAHKNWSDILKSLKIDEISYDIEYEDIEAKKKRLRYLREFSKTERLLINALNKRFESIKPAS